MGLFTFTDIKFESKNRIRSGDLGVADEFKMNMLKYPEDIGSVDKGHYMIFSIHVQDKTEYAVNFASNPDSKVQAGRRRLQASTGAVNAGGMSKQLGGAVGSIVSSVPDSVTQFGSTIAGVLGNATGTAGTILETIFPDSLIKGGKEVGAVGGQFVNTLKNDLKTLDNVNFLRTTKRTTDSIALYMPNTLNFVQTQGFDDLALGSENINKIASMASVTASGGGDTGKNLTPFIQEIGANFLGRLGENTAKAIFASVAGVTKNPRMEMIYTGPGEFRTFRFSFMFYPRSSSEAREVQAIIARFNFHQVPEIKTGTAGYFLVPPSEFDIDFYYNGKVNPNIPEITTCVLESVDVDYAPDGFQAFELGDSDVMVGGTGMPVGIRMDLEFKETAIMTKIDFENKRGTGARKAIPESVPAFTNKITPQ